MAADTKRIEEEAVDAVKRTIRTVELLSAYISDNDKGPCWDGYIAVHKDSSKSRDGIRRVHVQVKGKEADSLDEEEIKYVTNIIDLEAYREEGGVIYFVVYEQYIEGERFPRTKIYYQELLPYKIYSILERKKRKDQKEITVIFKAFPEEPQRIMTIFLQFLENRLHQSAFSGKSIPDVKRIKEDHQKYEIPLTLFGRDANNPIQAFLSSDSYFYVRSEDLNTLIPVGMVDNNAEAIQDLESNVSVNGVTFYSHFTLITKKKSSKIRIGHSIFVETKEGKWIIQYKPPVYIRQLVRDQKFIIALIENGGFEIDEKIIFLEQAQIQDFKDVAVLPLQIMKTYERIDHMLDVCGCVNETDGSVDINYTGLSEKDCHFLDALCQGVLDHKIITGITAPEGAFTCFDINGKKIIVGISEECGGYRLEKIDDKKWRFMVRSKDGEETEIPVCFIYKKEEFEKGLNIPFSDFLSMLKSVPQTSNLYGYANNLVLDMISAYDITNGVRKGTLFDTALQITEWLNSVDVLEGEWDNNISKLNRFQLLKRRRELTKDEKEEIETIIDSSDGSDEIRFGGYLLLDEKRRAKTFYDKFDKGLKAAYKKMPIYRFFKS